MTEPDATVDATATATDVAQGGTPSATPLASRKSGATRWLRLVGIVILAYLLLFRVDRHALRELAVHTSPWLLLLATLINAPVIFIKSERWRLLLRAQRLRYGRAPALKAFVASQYVGIITPGRVGDLTRVVYLRRDLGLSLGAGAPSVIADRLLDLYFLLAVGFVACLRFGVGFSLVGLVGAGVIATLPALILVPGVVDRLERVGLVARVLRRFGRAAPQGDAADRASSAMDFTQAARALLSWRLVGGLVLTVVGYAGTFLQVLLLARALRLDVGFIDLSLMTAAANLLALVPISISGIGTRDAALAFLFARLGQSPDAGIALSLAILLTAWLPMAIVGFFAFELWPPPGRAVTAAVTATTDAVVNAEAPPVAAKGAER
jgi:uncharacterized protein (TIRG00374 family)